MVIVEQPCIEAWSLLTLCDLLNAQKHPFRPSNQLASEASSPGGASREATAPGTFIQPGATLSGTSPGRATTEPGTSEPDHSARHKRNHKGGKR
jgi:hypothetical protein